MGFESIPQNTAETDRKRLHENVGVVFCTKKKGGEHIALEGQAEQAEVLNLPTVQFDFRKRTDEELFAGQERLRTYREKNPETYLSIHGETPKVITENGGIENSDRIEQELRIARDLRAESYTVHPPRIGLETWKSLPDDAREKILREYVSVFVGEVAGIAPEENFCVAFENMPTKGDEGVFGQTIEEIRSLAERLENALVVAGVDSETARKRVGVTLDVNHALHGVSDERWEGELAQWFEQLGERIKVIHVYTPSSLKDDLKIKYKLTLTLAALHSPDAKIFMESKQEPDITASVYTAVRSGTDS